MSQMKYVGIGLALACGIATGYSTFAPELQRVQAEKAAERTRREEVSVPDHDTPRADAAQGAGQQSSARSALDDYKMQLTLLEAQNKDDNAIPPEAAVQPQRRVGRREGL